MQCDWMWKPINPRPAARPAVPLPRADAERLRIGPRECARRWRPAHPAALLDHSRQQREMVILHQHHGLLGPRISSRQRIGELLVHRAVMFPVVREKSDACGRCGTAARAPRWRIRSNNLLLLLCVSQTRRSVYCGSSGGTRSGPGCPPPPVGIAGAVGDPGSVAGAQHRLKRRHQPARRHVTSTDFPCRMCV